MRVLSRDEFRGGYSIGAASLGILKYQVFLEQPQEVPVGFFDLFADKTPEEPAEAQLTAYVQGKVQGVGFRWWCAGAAKPLGLSGYAENLDDGRVRVIPPGMWTLWMRLSPNRRARSRGSGPGSALPCRPAKKALYVNKASETPLYSHKEPFYAPDAPRSMPQMPGNVE